MKTDAHSPSETIRALVARLEKDIQRLRAYVENPDPETFTVPDVDALEQADQDLAEGATTRLA